MDDIDQFEALLVAVDTHVTWLRQWADGLTGEFAKTALAADTAAEQLELQANRLREHLRLGDTAVLPIEER